MTILSLICYHELYIKMDSICLLTFKGYLWFRLEVCFEALLLFVFINSDV